MRSVYLLAICFFCFGSTAVVGQQSFTIYADQKGNDTLTKLITVLKQQLARSRSYRITETAAAKFRGNGIYIGLASASMGLSDPEAFSVNADGKGVRILGNSNMAIGHGIFAWLERLGYRFYFANPDWHIIPSVSNLFRQTKFQSKPDFNHRRIWYGYGTGSKIADEHYNFWMMANKQGGSLNASFGHAYGNIVARNKAAFQQHPEWFYPTPAKGTIPDNPKFDMTNEGLVQLVIDDVEKQIKTSLQKRTAAYKMISVSPSDGVGTCNTPACQALGTMTDRVYHLANRVAKSIRNKYPSTLIGCLAYSEYIAPPSIPLEPNIFVGITTAFNTSDYNTTQLIDLWKRKGVTVGIYDYFSWYMWDYDVPGQSLASRTSELTQTIKRYYEAGVRAYEAESSIGWINKGLGYYIAARMMWDINTNVNEIKRQFFSDCFGRAASQMENLWQSWENYSFTNIRESDLAQWIDIVSSAETLERKNGAIQKRFFQIKSYLHYLYLYRLYLVEKSEENLLALLNYGYRKFDDGSVSGYPAIFAIGARSGFKGMGFTTDARWRTNSRPVTINEINKLIATDRQNLKKELVAKSFTPAVKFTTLPDLKRFSKLYSDSSNKIYNNFWLENEFVIEIKTKGAMNYLTIIGDYVANPNNKRPIKVKVFPYTANGNVKDAIPLVTYDYTSMQKEETVSLASLAPGYYTLLVEDPTKVFKIFFSNSINYSAVTRPTRQLENKTLNYAFIYVPETVTFFKALKTRNLEFTTPSGRNIKFENNKVEEVKVEVKPGEAGLWRMKVADRLFLDGVPPYIGTSPAQMLIPFEINK